jgi:nicotinamidase-related amidase
LSTGTTKKLLQIKVKLSCRAILSLANFVMDRTWTGHPAKEYDRVNVLASTKDTALLVIDMQEHFRESATGIISNVRDVIQTCHDLEVPIFYTQHGHKDIKVDGGALAKWWTDNIQYGSASWQFLKEIKPYVTKNDIVITEKTRYDSFIRTPLKQKLDDLNIKTIIIAGCITNLCCETTARAAFNLDYNVIFLGDGCGSFDQQAHQGTLRNISIGFARVVSCKQLIEQLNKS